MTVRDTQKQELPVTTRPLTALAALAACAAMLLPAMAHSAGPKLNIPDFSHLRSKAVESTDITIDGFLLDLARKFAEHEDVEAREVLADIKSVRVRNFEFDSDNAYSRADIEKVRAQLSAPGWSPVLQTHKRDDNEDVDVYLNIDDGKILGVAVVAMEPRSFTIVNVIGNIDMEKLAKIEGDLGIPRVRQTE
jgi:hypothetical protein